MDHLAFEQVFLLANFLHKLTAERALHICSSSSSRLCFAVLGFYTVINNCIS